MNYLTWEELILRVLLIFWHKYFNPLVHSVGTSSPVDLLGVSSFVMSSAPLHSYWLALIKMTRSQNNRHEERWVGSRLLTTKVSERHEHLTEKWVGKWHKSVSGMRREETRPPGGVCRWLSCLCRLHTTKVKLKLMSIFAQSYTVTQHIYEVYSLTHMSYLPVA